MNSALSRSTSESFYFYGHIGVSEHVLSARNVDATSTKESELPMYVIYKMAALSLHVYHQGIDFSRPIETSLIIIFIILIAYNNYNSERRFL